MILSISVYSNSTVYCAHRLINESAGEQRDRNCCQLYDSTEHGARCAPAAALQHEEPGPNFPVNILQESYPPQQLGRRPPPANTAGTVKGKRDPPPFQYGRSVQSMEKEDHTPPSPFLPARHSHPHTSEAHPSQTTPRAALHLHYCASILLPERMREGMREGSLAGVTLGVILGVSIRRGAKASSWAI